ncbi:MAG: HAD family hydrolase [Chthoniobacterales bacterium]
MPRKAVIFDLDGTLVDSLPGLTLSLNAALEKSDHPPYTEKQVRNFIGNGAQQLIKNALPDATPETLQEALGIFLNHYRENWQRGTVLFPGIRELLRELKMRHWKLGLLSNKPDEFVQEIVQKLFPPSLFDQVLGQCPKTPQKPNPEAALKMLQNFQISPGKCLFIGDSLIDIETAKNASIPSIAVTWGYEDPQNLLTATSTAQTPKDLHKLLISKGGH